MKYSLHALSGLLLTLLILSACAGLAPAPQQIASDEPSVAQGPTSKPLRTRLPSPGERCEEVVLSFTQDEPFRQISWMVTDAESSFVQYRIPTGSADDWTPWKPVEITFEEGRAYNARILLDAAANFLELRGDPSLEKVHISLQPRITARRTPIQHTSLKSPSSLPAPTVSQDPVLTRHHWGALPTPPDCGHPTRPRRLSFHHTAAPHDDGDDAAARMRQIQSFHINERGWCDIGYHYLIAQSGEVFQGRARADRTGAHVAGQNQGNVGVAFIGDFTVGPPTSAQIDAAIALTRQLHLTHRIPLTRDAIRGHHEWPGQKTQCPGDKINIGDLDTIAYIVERAAFDPTASPVLISENHLKEAEEASSLQ